MRVRSTCVLLLVFVCPTASFAGGQSPSIQRTLDDALHGTGASAVLLGVVDGGVLASYGRTDAESAPGSTLKPLILQAALTSHVLTDRTTVLCRGTLVIGGHNLACTHSRDVLRMDARLALSNSCNTYFARVAERMSAAQLREALRGYGLPPATQAVTPDRRALLALGVEGITVTPRQLADAYRRLAHEPALTEAVREGLLDSVDIGMAHAAHIEHLPTGVRLGGKTGTMHDSSDPRGHGWFAGIVFNGAVAEEVLVVCLPGGNGADAARLAGQILKTQLLLQAGMGVR